MAQWWYAFVFLLWKSLVRSDKCDLDASEHDLAPKNVSTALSASSIAERDSSPQSSEDSGEHRRVSDQTTSAHSSLSSLPRRPTTRSVTLNSANLRNVPLQASNARQSQSGRSPSVSGTRSAKPSSTSITKARGGKGKRPPTPPGSDVSESPNNNTEATEPPRKKARLIESEVYDAIQVSPDEVSCRSTAVVHR